MNGILMERTEIAKALNFCKYPVLSIDLENQPYRNDIAAAGRKDTYVKGCKCRVAWDHKSPQYAGMTIKCELVIENGEYKLTSWGCMLKADYTLNDFLENVKAANTPLVHKGETVAVAHYSQVSGIKFIRLMRVSERIDTNCQVVATLKPIED